MHRTAVVFPMKGIVNPESANHNKCRSFSRLLKCFRSISDNVDTDQTAPIGHCLPLYLNKSNIASKYMQQTT